MMKYSALHKIFALSLAFILLFSSTGMAMDMHYCNGNLKSISLFGTAKSCHTKSNVPPCHMAQQKAQDQHEGCCENQQVVIEKGQFDATAPQHTALEGISLEFIYAIVAVFVIPQDIAKKAEYIPHFKPPLPKRNQQAHLQTFLI